MFNFVDFCVYEYNMILTLRQGEKQFFYISLLKTSLKLSKFVYMHKYIMQILWFSVIRGLDFFDKKKISYCFWEKSVV